MPIEIRPQMLYNPTMRQPEFFCSGRRRHRPANRTTFATAMAVVREKERGTLEQLLVVLSRWALMPGKLIPYLCIGMLMACLLFRHHAFCIFRANRRQHCGDDHLHAFTFLLFSAWAARRHESGKPDAGAPDVDGVHSPERFLLRLHFPSRNDAGIFYGLGAILPTTYFIALMRAIILRGATFVEFAPSLGILTGMAVLLFCVCALRFRKKIG